MSFPRICFFALHPFATSRSSATETLTRVDPAVCASESAAPAAATRLISAQRTAVFTMLLLSVGRSHDRLLGSSRGPSEWSNTLIAAAWELDLGPAELARGDDSAIGVRSAS